MILLTFHSFDLELVWNSERGISEFLGCAVCILLCLFLLHDRQARGKDDGLFLCSIFPSAHLLLSFSLSLAENELENCLHMLRDVDTSGKADGWNRRFDKLPVISAKLTLHVTAVDMSGKTDGWNRRFNKLPVISAKLTLHVTDVDTSGKAYASSISGIASSISEIPSSAEVACDKCRQI
ncbi:hypothetical protein ACFX2G_030096 [Malus domestica]